MKFSEISEYPYHGTVTRITQGQGGEDDIEEVVYDGAMDEHLVTEEVGRTMQTSNYIISMPLTKNKDGEWIVPRKGDRITLDRYGESITFNVDNSEPSQLGGISVYASRNSW